MAKKNRNEDTPVNESLPADEVAAPKKTQFCAVDTDQSGITHFTFGDGQSVSINPNELPEEVQSQLMYHGLVQKVRDSFASAKGDFTVGLTSASKVVSQLKEGNWTASRAGGESKPKTTELAQALANLKGVPLDIVQAAVEKATDAKRKEWRNNTKVAAEIANIRAINARARAEKAQKESPEDLDLNLDEAIA